MEPTANEVNVYARRKARMAFLRGRVDEDHPVLMAESNLVEMARSKLLESLLAEHGEAGLPAARPAVESAVRAAMRLSAPSLVSDPDGAARLCEDMDREPLDSLFLPRGR